MNFNNVQLLFVHLQTSLVAGGKTLLPHLLANASGTLLNAADALTLPVTFSVVPGRGALLPELDTRSDRHVFDCHAASAFLNVAMVSHLAAVKRGTLIVSGFATEVATLHTCMDAIAAGYSVVVPVDATSGTSVRTEAAAFRQLELAGCTVTSVASIVSSMAPDFTTPMGQHILTLLNKINSMGADDFNAVG